MQGSHSIRALAFAGLCAVAIPSFAVAVYGQGTWETSLQPRDVDHDGVVDAYYDNELNVTWRAQAYYNGPPPGRPPERPLLFMSDAVEWVGSLGPGWRLPRVDNVVGAFRGFGFPCDPRFCGPFPDVTVSEMAHMFYVTLGNSSAAGLVNTGPFRDLIPGTYWTNSQAEPTDFVWSFQMGNGTQIPVDPVGGRPYGAWALYDGDIAPVPVPGTLPLIALGLAVVGSFARRRT